MYGYCDYNYGPFGMILWILVWVLIFTVIVRVARGSLWPGYYRDRRDRSWFDDQNRVISKDALDILNERYARGEIDKEEYEIRKADILK